MLDLCCFGFLSALRIMCIEHYPQPNSGSLVSDVFGMITPDAPIVAILSSVLGLEVGLVSNNVGDDSAGNELIQLLASYHIRTTVSASKGISTPFTIGLCDQQENRTWFSFLPDVVEGLLASNLDMLRSSRMAYIDLYSVLSRATPRIIQHAIEHRVPLFVNLGGDPLPEQMAQLLRRARVVVVQTSVDATFMGNPEEYLREIQERIEPEIAVVTMGSGGAICGTPSLIMHVPAYKIQVIHCDGPGAAFSAGLAYALLNGWDLEKAVSFASALGGLYCTERDGFGKFPSDFVHQFMQGIRSG